MNYMTCKDCGVRLSSRNQYPSCHRQKQKCCKKCWNNRFYFAVRKHKYGLTKVEVLALIAAQDSKCAICGVDVSVKFAIDHDHKTMAIRGILCRTCNTGMGMLKDSAQVLLKAYEYLCRHDSKETQNAEIVGTTT
jgi:Recombination endonuclease VII